MKSYLKLLIITGILFSLHPAFSEDDYGRLDGGKFGLSFYTSQPLLTLEIGSSTDPLRSLGISAIYHANESFALEPSVFWVGTYGEEKSGTSKETEEDDMIGSSLGVFYYSNVNKGLHLYIGPRISYAYSFRTNEFSSGDKNEEEEKGYEIAAVFGLKYMFNDNIGIFGDICFAYSKSKSTEKEFDVSGTLTDKDTYENEVTRLGSSLLGVSFYF